LGPLLFNIFINDVNYCISNVSIRLYADDTTTYAADVSPTVLEFIVNNDLKTLSSWFKDNYLSVNDTKTQALSIGPCKYIYDLYMNNSKIELSDDVKILGVTLDSKLNYKSHITDQLNKAYAKTSAIRRIRRFLPTEQLTMLYKTFILPHLEYCSPLLLGLGKVQSDRLEDANYFILRSILGYSKSVPYEHLLQTVKLGRLSQRRVYQSLIMVYKCVYDNGPEYLKNLFDLKITPYTLRGNGHKLVLPKFNLEWKKKSFSYQSVQHWNKLPNDIFDAQNLSQFKNRLKKILF